MTIGLLLLSQSAPAVGAAASSANSAWLAAGLILLAAGVAIAALELFLPSAGILSVAAATALVASVACFFMYDTLWGFGALAFYAAGAPVAILLGLKLWTHTPLARGMVLGGAPGEEEDSDGPTSGTERGTNSAGTELGSERAQAKALVGRTGITITPLRPVGFVRLGEDRLEVQAETGMIEPGTRVTIIESFGGRIVVRPSDE